MTPIHLRFRRSFYLRHGFVGGLLLFFCLVMVFMLKHLGPLRFLAPVVFLGPWLFLILREVRLSAKTLDHAGVTRRDGRRFLWADLHQTLDVRMHLTPGQPGPLNHVDLLFAGGKVRILFMVLENGLEAIRFAKNKESAILTRLRQRLCQLIPHAAARIATRDDPSATSRENAWSHRDPQDPSARWSRP